MYISSQQVITYVLGIPTFTKDVYSVSIAPKLKLSDIHKKFYNGLTRLFKIANNFREHNTFGLSGGSSF